MHPATRSRAYRPTAAWRSLILLGVAVGVLFTNTLPRPVLAVPQGAPLAESEVASNMIDTAAIDRYVANAMADARLPGAALAIVQGDRIAYLKGYGVADSAGTRVTPQTVFTLGSTTKSFTALAVMQLVEAGKVALDGPVQRYLPWFRVGNVDAGAPITVRHLLTHTSGISVQAGLAGVTRADTRDDALEQAVRALRQTPVVAPAGTRFEYSNANYTILGLIVQAVSGQSFEQYVLDHVLVPLAMTHSSTAPHDGRDQHHAVGYRYWFNHPVAYAMPYNRAQVPAGFLQSTAEDLSHYLIAQLNGGQYGATSILSPAGIAALHHPLVQTDDRPGAEAYAMGWFVSTVDGTTLVQHAGSTANFHSNLILVPEQHVGVALLMNGENALEPAQISSIAAGVTRLVLGQAPQPIRSTSVYLLMLYLVGLVSVLHVVGFVRTRWLLRRWRHTAGMTIYPRWRLVLHLVPPVMLNAVWASLGLVVLPQLLGTPLSTMRVLVPDVTSILLLSCGWATGWALVRPMLLLRALHTDHHHAKRAESFLTASRTGNHR